MLPGCLCLVSPLVWSDCGVPSQTGGRTPDVENVLPYVVRAALRFLARYGHVPISTGELKLPGFARPDSRGRLSLRGLAA